MKCIALAILTLFAASVRADVKKTYETWHDKGRDRDVPVRIYLDAATTKPSPVILLSHGLGGTRGAMAYAAEAWAAHGYVCITLQHAGSDESIWRGAAPGQRLAAIKAGMNARAYIDRCRDVTFAIDELARRNQASGALKDRVDLDRVGVAGHSFGAQTVQAIIGQRSSLMPDLASPLAEPRVRAAIAFSPSYARDDAKTAFADVRVPCFHFTGTQDSAPLVSETTPAQRRVPFDAIAAPEQYLLILDGGDHAVFGDTPGRAQPPTYAAWHQLIVDLSTHFWDAELKDDAAAKTWLHERAKDAVGGTGTYEMKAATRP